MSGISLQSSGDTSAIAAYNAKHGWAEFFDTEYTDVARYSLVADTDINLPNNGVNGFKLEIPPDTDLYNPATQKITGIQREMRIITVSMDVTPTNVGTTLLETWFDIGGAVGEIYRRPHSFPKGNGVTRGITFTEQVFTLDTWEANGAALMVRANGTAEIHGIRYVIKRSFVKL